MPNQRVTINLKHKIKTDASFGFPTGHMEPDPKKPGEQREKLIFIGFSKCEEVGPGLYEVEEWIVDREGLGAFVVA